MSVPLETKTPKALLTRLDEIIEELQELRLVARELWEKGELTSATINGVTIKPQSASQPADEDLVEMLWGACGQQSMDEIREAYQQDIYLEMFSNEPAS